MGRETNISWTDSTWNAIRGCSRVSEGCRHCYAETIAHRFSGPGLPYEGLVQLSAAGKSTGKWNGQIKFLEEHLLDPLRWKKPRRIFINSMSDLFHENVIDEMRDKIFAVMALCPQHTFQVLTKRPERMLAYLRADDAPLRWADAPADFDYGSKADDQRVYNAMCVRDDAKRDAKGMVHLDNPLPNVHLGVSVEDQKTADQRIPILLQTPAAVRFISAEPLLGPVNLDSRPISFDQSEACGECGSQVGAQDLFTSTVHCGNPDCTSCGESLALGRIDWVIVGGESGAGARPMHPDWARSLRDQCKAAGVPFFFKQWGDYVSVSEVAGPGAHLQFPDGATVRRVGTKAAGCLLDGVEHHQFPEVR